MTRAFWIMLSIVAFAVVVVLAAAVDVQQGAAQEQEQRRAAARLREFSAIEQQQAQEVASLLQASQQRMAQRWQEDLRTHGVLLPAETKTALEQCIDIGLRRQVSTDATSVAQLNATRATLQRLETAAAEAAAGTPPPDLATPIAIGLLCCTAALWVWWHFLVRRPLLLLAQEARQQGAGAVVGAGGVGQVLAEALQEVMAELHAARAELELRVDDKTRQLGTALEVQRTQSQKLTELLDALQRTREQLLRQEKLAAVGTLAAGVAHEFNNILGGIRGCAREAAAEKPTASVQECIDMILKASDRGRAIVEGLGHLGRPQRPESGPCDVAATVADVLQLLQAQAVDAGVRIDSTVASGVQVAAPPGAVLQMLLNLLRNALQASPPGEAVSVVTTRSGNRVRLCVADRGSGVPTELRARLFEPFFTTRERSGGTGLGLAITHGLALQCAGTTGYAAREGGGSEFWCELPVPEVAA